MREGGLVVAGIDVHKSVLMVVVGRAGESESQGPRARFGTVRSALRDLVIWLQEQQVTTVVMESTAQYWWPVWLELEGRFHLHLAQARSNAAPHGRKTDWGDAARLVRRYLAGDLRLSFVPDAAQRSWRRLARTWKSLREAIIAAGNEIEAVLEEGQIKLSSLVSELLGVGARRILHALAQGVTDPQALAATAQTALRATPEQLRDALDGRLGAAQRLVLQLHLERITLLERQQGELERQLQAETAAHTEALQRLCEVPGIALVAAQRLLAEIGARAAAFPSAGHLASWAGLCPGRAESAGQSRSDRCAKGNRAVRALMAQVAHAAVRTKGSHWEALFARWRGRLGVAKAIWAVAHRLLRLIWTLLAHGERYRESGPRQESEAQLRRRMRRLERQFRAQGYQVQFTPLPRSEQRLIPPANA